jgi:hypothetical protein
MLFPGECAIGCKGGVLGLSGERRRKKDDWYERRHTNRLVVLYFSHRVINLVHPGDPWLIEE